MADTGSDYNVVSNWRPSIQEGGSPGSAEPFIPLGDGNFDQQFNQLDLVLALQGGKYLSSQPATWSEGDWNGDGVFDQRDIVAVLQAGTFDENIQMAMSHSETVDEFMKSLK